MRPAPRRSVLAAVLLVALCSLVSPAGAQEPGIVDGRSMRVAGSHTFTFTPNGSETVSWSLDKETISESGVATRTNALASRTGLTATFTLSPSSSVETFYYIRATQAGFEDVDTVQVFASNTRTWFTYRSAGNPDVRVYAVFPATASPESRVLLAMHGNSRTASDYADIWRSWATQHDYIVLCPYYDLTNWPTTGMYHMGNVFSGDDCNGTLNPEERWTFTIDLGIHQRVLEGFGLLDPRFDMFGFSGGGQHVHRFMLFKPNAPVRVAIAAGSGWYTAPDRAIDCPYGVDECPQLDFSSQEVLDWTNRNMVIMVGTEDTVRDEDLRITARADAQGQNRYERADYMMRKAIDFNPATRWRRVDVPGAAHSAKDVSQGAMNVLALAPLVETPRAPLVPAPPRPQLRVSPNPVPAIASLSGEGWGDEDVQIEIFDLAGRRIAAGTAPVIDGRWRLGWSGLTGGRSIAKGIYLVRARDGQRHAEQKVVVTE